MEKIGIGIVGLGMIATGVHLPGIQKCPEQVQPVSNNFYGIDCCDRPNIFLHNESDQQ